MTLNNKNNVHKSTVCSFTPEAAAVIARMKSETKEGYRFNVREAVSRLVVREWGK
jgi:hypothetical protein